MQQDEEKNPLYRDPSIHFQHNVFIYFSCPRESFRKMQSTHRCAPTCDTVYILCSVMGSTALVICKGRGV